MSTTRSKATKTKSNSHKKLRKPARDGQDNAMPSTQCHIGIQTMDNKKISTENPARKSNRDTSICKSLENIMHLKNTNQDAISMSKTDISIVYGMYKSLIQKQNVNNEIHVENFKNLLNELHKFQDQLNEQDLCQKSLVNLVTASMPRHRIDRRLRRKQVNRVNKRMILKLSQITSAISQLHRTIETLETKNLTSKIEKSVATPDFENSHEKKKRSVFCSCM